MREYTVTFTEEEMSVVMQGLALLQDSTPFDDTYEIAQRALNACCAEIEG